MSAKYFGLFTDRDKVAREFGAGSGSGWDDKNPFVPQDDFPTDDQILLAAYEYEDYSGDAFVLFERDGKLFEVHGGHCSCYGLEDQWQPEETSWAAIRMREGYDRPLATIQTDAARSRLEELLAAEVTG